MDEHSNKVLPEPPFIPTTLLQHVYIALWKIFIRPHIEEGNGCRSLSSIKSNWVNLINSLTTPKPNLNKGNKCHIMISHQ